MTEYVKTEWFVVSCDGKFNARDSDTGPMATGAPYWNTHGKSILPIPEDRAREFFAKPSIGYESLKGKVTNRILYRIVLEVVEQDTGIAEPLPVEVAKRREFRRNALAKLSPEERRELGVIEYADDLR